MKRFLIFQLTTLGLALAVFSPAIVAKPQPTQVADKAASSVTMWDRSWLRGTAKEGDEEMRLGQLAAQLGSSPEVRALGQQMVNAQNVVNKEIKMLADKKGIQLDQPEATSVHYIKLSTLSGAPFDKEYVSVLIAGHKEEILAFEKQARKGGDPNLSAWAGKQIPALQHQLSAVESIQQRLNLK